MAISVLFQYLIDSEKKLENRFDLPAGGLQFVFSSSFPLLNPKKLFFFGILWLLLVIFMIESGFVGVQTDLTFSYPLIGLFI